MNQQLEDIVRSELATLGLDLFDLVQRGSKQRPVIEVRIDRPDAEIKVEDCTKASRAIEARLDQGGVVAENYVLEVSSPGVERPLRSAAEWRRFVGRRASVNSPALNGRVEAEIVSVEGEPGTETIVLRAERGDEHRVPLAEVKDARLAFHWKR
jgi:ribosome maturation factor RimP